MDAAGTISSDSGHTRSKTGRFRAKRWNPDEGLGAAFCCRGVWRSGQVGCAKCKWRGTDSALKRRLFRKVTAAKKEGGMENFLLFVLSSSFCTLVAGVTLLLRPLVGLP
jgi:hypothetical protein